MARFYGTVRSREAGQRSRGSDEELTCHTRGWKMGCRVVLFADPETNEDCMRIEITQGSLNPAGRIIFVGTLEDLQESLKSGGLAPQG